MRFVQPAVFLLLSVLLVLYVVLPGPSFPDPPPDARRSEEDGDNETPLRRAYFTNYTRGEVVDFYNNQFLGIRLNYPPEESQTLIRDQTRSTFLEEIVQPLRGSVYVNGWEPLNPKDDVWYKGVDYRQKIIIKFIPSGILIRIFIALASVACFWFLSKLWFSALSDLGRAIWKRN